MENAKNTINNFFKRYLTKRTRVLMIEGLLLLGAAILMFINPSQTIFVMVATLGILMTVFGALNLLRAIVNAEYIPSIALDIIFSVANIILGIVLIAFPQLSFSILVAIIGVILLIRTIYLLSMSVSMLKIDTVGGILGIISAALSAILVIAVIMFPLSAAYLLTYFIAGCLLFYALIDFVLAFRTRKFKKTLPIE